jgi:acyl dehydratase
LSVRLHIISLRRSEKRPDLGLVGTRLEARNQRDEPVLTWESTAFFGCRPARALDGDPGRR